MDKMMHQLDECCRQARALFWEEHKRPRDPRSHIEMGGCGGRCPLLPFTDVSLPPLSVVVWVVHHFVHQPTRRCLGGSKSSSFLVRTTFVALARDAYEIRVSRSRDKAPCIPAFLLCVSTRGGEPGAYSAPRYRKCPAAQSLVAKGSGCSAGRGLAGSDLLPSPLA